MPEWSGNLLQQVSQWSTPVITGIGIIHFLAFLWLNLWARRDLRQLSFGFEVFTRELTHRSQLEPGAPLSDQLDAFLADVKDVLDDPRRQAERRALHERIKVLDEERRYLQSHRFDTFYNVCRTMIEAYPLAGVLGTILAIGGALQASPEDQSNTISTVVRFFGDAIWSTFAGLLAAVWLMLINSLFEPRFLRLSETRANVRETIARAKRELTFTPTEGAAP